MVVWKNYINKCVFVICLGKIWENGRSVIGVHNIVFFFIQKNNKRVSTKQKR